MVLIPGTPWGPAEPFRAGKRNRCYFCNRGDHKKPRWPHRARRSTGVIHFLPPPSVASRPPSSSISFGNPAVFDLKPDVQRDVSEAPYEGPFSISAESCSGIPLKMGDSGVVSETGATVKAACFKCPSVWNPQGACLPRAPAAQIW